MSDEPNTLVNPDTNAIRHLVRELVEPFNPPESWWRIVERGIAWCHVVGRDPDHRWDVVPRDGGVPIASGMTHEVAMLLTLSVNALKTLMAEIWSLDRYAVSLVRENKGWREYVASRGPEAVAAHPEGTET